MDKGLYEKIISKRNARSYKSLFNKRLYQYASLVLTVYAIGMFLSENNGIVYNNNQGNKRGRKRNSSVYWKSE